MTIQEIISTLRENENYKYLGILEVDFIKQTDMKEEIRKEYLRRIRILLKTKLCRRKLIKWKTSVQPSFSNTQDHS